MKRNIGILNMLTILSSFLVWAQPLYAVDLELRPRLETGATVYSIEFGATSKSVLTRMGEASGNNITQEEFEFVDTMGFVGGGTTFFINRLFVDFSGQYAFNGSDITTSPWSTFDVEDSNGDSLLVSMQPTDRAEFNRADYAVSVGYAVSQSFSVFAGYKWATVDLDNTFRGDLSLLNINNYLLNGSVSGREAMDFRYEGPFVGLTHGWRMDADTLLQGMLSINLGLAYLTSELKLDTIGITRYDTRDGQNIDPIITRDDSSDETKGKTFGLALGVNWIGTTPIENLSYSVGISGHRYQFESDDSLREDIRESAVTCKVGIAYLF